MVDSKSRGAYLIGLMIFGNYNIEDIEDFTVYIPKADPHFATSLAVIFLQLLGYYVSVNKSRNLAKSVTVEQEQLALTKNIRSRTEFQRFSLIY